MRFWIGGPRVLGLRTGVSFGPEDIRITRRRSATASAESVYVITGDHGRVKVGVSTNPAARLAQLQTSSPFPLAVAFTAEASDAYAVERVAHELLQAHRVSGEWFHCSKELAIAAVSASAAKLGTTLSGRTQVVAPRRPEWHRLVRYAALGAIAIVSAVFTAFVFLLLRIAYGTP